MNVLYVSEGLFHPTKRSQNLVGKYIKEYFATSDSIKHIKTNGLIREDLDGYGLVILYFHIKQDDVGAINQIESYVAKGGTVIGIHGVCASYKKSQTWFDIFGGKFKTHPPVGELHIGEDKIIDEMYLFDLLESNILLESYLDGEKEPCIWRNRYKKGVAYYYALGHDNGAVKNSVFKKYLYLTLYYWRQENE